MKPIRPRFHETGADFVAPAGFENATQNKFFRIIDSPAQITERTRFDKQLYQGL